MKLEAEAIKRLRDLRNAYSNDEIGRAANEILDDLNYNIAVAGTPMNGILDLIFVMIYSITKTYLLITGHKYKNIENLAVVLSKRFPACQAAISKFLDDYHTCRTREPAKICRMLVIIAVLKAADHVRLQELSGTSN